MNKKEIGQALNELHREACEKCWKQCAGYSEALTCKVYININRLLELVGT